MTPSSEPSGAPCGRPRTALPSRCTVSPKLPSPSVPAWASAALALTIALLSLPAEAQIEDFSTLLDPALAEEDFEGNLQFGFINRTGNDDSSSLNGRTNLTWYRDRWSYNLYASADSARSGDESTAERYVGAARTRYNLAEDNYVFGQLRLNVDRFSGYDNQLSLAGGYGRQLVDTRPHSLSVEIGPGIRRDKIRNGDVDYRALAYAGFNYGYRLSDTARFEQGFATEAAGDDLTLRSETSSSLSINADFSLRLAYLVEHNSDPPDDAEYRTDTTTTMSIVYGL
ncbi:DUF481 domain-containing protein [Halotalea alkalilenta]|uniref:DUF481 domain-containing protein n=1 Tax=Halotalea alkalilenta TaxID=376489 RepID=UPI000693E5AC|nr:DUF481 domain-containing protein [Halotalea alkalilenta]